jgi:hypothetical protein
MSDSCSITFDTLLPISIVRAVKPTKTTAPTISDILAPTLRFENMINSVVYMYFN